MRLIPVMVQPRALRTGFTCLPPSTVSDSTDIRHEMIRGWVSGGQGCPSDSRRIEGPPPQCREWVVSSTGARSPPSIKCSLFLSVCLHGCPLACGPLARRPKSRRCGNEAGCEIPAFREAILLVDSELNWNWNLSVRAIERREWALVRIRCV